MDRKLPPPNGCWAKMLRRDPVVNHCTELFATSAGQYPTVLLYLSRPRLTACSHPGKTKPHRRIQECNSSVRQHPTIGAAARILQLPTDLRRETEPAHSWEHDLPADQRFRQCQKCVSGPHHQSFPPGAESRRSVQSESRHAFLVGVALPLMFVS